MTSDRGRLACWHRLRSTHTLHNNKISIRTIMTIISLLLQYYGNPTTQTR